MSSFVDFLKDIESKNLLASIVTISSIVFMCSQAYIIEAVLSDCVVLKHKEDQQIVVIPFSAISHINLH